MYERGSHKARIATLVGSRLIPYCLVFVLVVINLVPRSLVDEAEGEIWPNPICITWSPVRNVTGEAIAHAQHKFGAVKADFVAYIEDITR